MERTGGSSGASGSTRFWPKHELPFDALRYPSALHAEYGPGGVTPT